MPGLLTTQQVAGTTNLQVLHGDRHTGPQIGVRRHRRQPVVGRLGDGFVCRVQEVRVPALPGATHPATQLVQLGESHEVGTVDEQGVGGGDVDAGLDDRRAHQDVGATLPEIHHDLLELFLGHLAVGGEHPGLGNEFADLLGRLLDGLHPIVDEEHLPLAGELTPDGGDDLALVVGAGKGEHRMAFLRRGGDGTHLTNTRHRHLQGARDRGGTHREHVDIDS